MFLNFTSLYQLVFSLVASGIGTSPIVMFGERLEVRIPLDEFVLAIQKKKKNLLLYPILKIEEAFKILNQALLKFYLIIKGHR